MKANIAIGVGLVAVVIALLSLGSNGSSSSFGGVTNFDTLYLGGTTGVTTTLAVGSTTPNSAGNATVDGAATTTVNITSSTASVGGCIQIENSSGVPTRAYVGAAGNAWIVEAGTCK